MLTDLLAARLQMALSLGFHIVFACIGMTMPWLMSLAEYRFRKTGDETYKELSIAWSKGVAIFFAIGAVSGTVLSFELGLLWPGFMKHAGPIIGMPFSWEGTAFFLEAIALGLFLYGWDRLSPRAHFVSGIMVGVCGVASGVLVVAANAWMNSPSGFDWKDGVATNIDPYAAMFNDAWFTQSLHMVLAAFASTGFAVAGVHAWRLWRLGTQHHSSAFHSKAMRIALTIGGVAALLQPLSGDLSAKDVAKRQPAKFAAMEAHFETTAPASLLVGGIPDTKTKTVSYGLHIPYALSFLAHADPTAEVVGLDQIPDDEEPPIAIVHFAFQIMVAMGMAMAGIALLFFFALWRKRDWLDSKRFLQLVALSTPIGFIALEAGWTVTEVGRQPFIIHGIMRTKDALTEVPGIAVSFYGSVVLYALLSLAASILLIRHIRSVEQS